MITVEEMPLSHMSFYWSLGSICKYTEISGSYCYDNQTMCVICHMEIIYYLIKTYFRLSNSSFKNIYGFTCISYIWYVRLNKYMCHGEGQNSVRNSRRLCDQIWSPQKGNQFICLLTHYS